MLPSGLDAAYIDELLQRQNSLQDEARLVINELNLFQLLSNIGHVEQFGSSVLGLMIWRDIDFNVYSPGLTVHEAFSALQPLLNHPNAVELLYSNEHGHHNPTGRLRDDRYFFAITYETEAGNKWKIDISFWLIDAIHDELTHLNNTLSKYLTDETRVIILWIKDIWHHLPCYPYQVSGTDIYYAVLEHNVCTPDQFKAYLAKQGKPTC